MDNQTNMDDFKAVQLGMTDDAFEGLLVITDVSGEGTTVQVTLTD